MAGVVFANKTVIVGSVTVRRGAAWDADSEMVSKYPQFFDAAPTKVATGGPRGGRERPAVETATRRPGEQRKTPRSNKADRQAENDD